MRPKAIIGILVSLTLPLVVLAAGNPPTGVSFDPHDNTIGSGKTLLTRSGSFSQLSFLIDGNDPLTIAINLINLALGFLGVLSLIMMAYAGVKWLFARDNEEAITSAKQIMVGAVVGLTITMSSLGITQLLFRVVRDATVVPPTSAVLQHVAEWFVPAAHAETLPFDPSTNAKALANTSIKKGFVWPKMTTIDLGTRDPYSLAISLVNIALSLLATIFLGLMLYAGIRWVSAAGNEETITKAKTTLMHSVIGLVIVLGSYGAATLIFTIIGFATGSGPYGEGLPI